MDTWRFRFKDVFKVENGRVFSKIPVKIKGVTIGPAVLCSDVDISVDQDISGYIENGILIVKGFYHN